ncbi:MAG: metallophosphoesterase [Clostridiales bacterium]|nr:metallophosphoesterase [Clostridiales bacterium]
MNDLTILHLSDLHFDLTGAQPYKLYKSLLNDINNELKYSKDIVIVVTGDLVNRANFQSEDLVLRFFKELKDIIIEKTLLTIHGIFFVPGNHDKKRTYSTSILSNINIVFDSKFQQHFKMFFEESYKEYHMLINKISKIFGFEYNENTTFGCEEVLINGKYFRFIRIDTAWAAQGNDDRRNLKIGQFQIDEIDAQYKEQQNNRNNDEKDEVTFVLAHHPLNWLSGLEEDLARNFFIGQRGIDADIFICGHTHTRDVINWSNNRHSLMTLSTGIGWPDSFDSDHSDLHAYAIYVLHLDLNALDIYVRSTNDGGHFVPDYRIYTSDENQKNNKIVLPIKSPSVQSYLSLGCVGNRSPKVCFLTNDFLKDIRKFVFAMGCFRQFAIECIESDVRSLSTTLDAIKNNEVSNDTYHKINQHFQSFLQSICDLLAEEILGNYKFEKDDRIRFHFRYCENPFRDSENLNYVKLCLSYWPDIDVKDKSLSSIEWGQLIKEAYAVKRPLIYSANPDSCNKKTKWLDFITIIPDFIENTFTIDKQHIQETRPYITFGASITSEKFRNILYCLDYYRFDRILTTLIHRYITKIPIDIHKFVEFINQAFGKDNLEEQNEIQ